MRFVWLQACFLAATAWVLWPLRDAAVLPLPTWPLYTPDAPDRQETLVVDHATLTPGTRAAARVIVHDPGRKIPLSGAQVRVSLSPQGNPTDLRHALQGFVLYEGISDAQGTAPVEFQVPALDEGEWNVVVDVRGPVGAQRVVRPIAIRRDVRLELATDRLAYSPGQTLHLWLRALDAARVLPLPGQPVAWSVQDARGNLICKSTASTSDYGVAHASCRLAERIDEGTYHVMASLKGTDLSDKAPERGVWVERAVRIEHHDRPLYDVKLATEETFALYGQRLGVTVQATYPWGQPVAGARVEVSATLAGDSAGEGGRPTAGAAPASVGKQGETDAEGRLRLVLNLDDLTSERASGDSILILTGRVTDREERVQEVEAWLPVAEQALDVRVEAQSSTLKPGIDNRIQVYTAYPDGRPAACALAVDAPGHDAPLQIETTPDGQGGFTYRPPGGRPPGGRPPGGVQGVPLIITAQDARGREVQERVELPVVTWTGPSTLGDPFLQIHPDRTSYRPGETVHLELVFRAASGTQSPSFAYLDVLHEEQMVAAYAAPMDGGRAALDIPLADGWSGPITLRAYALLGDVAPVVEARRIAVDSSSVLTVTVQADKAQYAPGDTAHLSIDVTGPRGLGTQSALALTVLSAGAETSLSAIGQVDGATSQEHAWSTAAEKGELRLARSDVLVRTRPTPEHVVQRFEAIAALRAARQQAFTAHAGRLIWALIVAVGVMGVSALGEVWSLAVQSRQNSGQAARGVVGGALGAGVVLPLLLGGSALLAYGSGKLFGPGTVLVLGLAWLSVLLALLVYAWQRGSSWSQVLWGAVLCVLALGGGLHYTLVQGAQLPQAWIVAGLAALAVVMLAIDLLAVILTRQGERGGAAAAWALVVTLLTTFAWAVLAGVPAQSPLRASRPVLPESTVVVEPAPDGGDERAPIPSSDVGAGLSRPDGGDERAPTPSSDVGAGLSRPDGRDDRAPTVGSDVGAGLSRPDGRDDRAPTVGSDVGAGLSGPDGRDDRAPTVGSDVGAGLPRPYRETVYWNPHALTDAGGQLTIDIPIPEHNTEQTEWRVSVAAAGAGGEFGTGQARLRVSRPLWIETSLPSALTVGDELDLPIRVYNSSPLSQTVRVTTTVDSWFTLRLLGADTQQIEVGGQSVGVLDVAIRVREWGRQRLEVVAVGEAGSDSLSQEVDVMPGGLRVWRVFSGQLDAAPRASPLNRDALSLALDYPGLSVPVVEPDPEPLPETRYKFRVPWSAVQGSERVTVTLYPNWESTLVESLGAADLYGPQASLDALAATIQANTLLYGYLEGGGVLPSRASAPEAMAEIRTALGLSYQQLLSYEADGGGFGVLNQVSPDVYHTAEALRCLSELARLIPVDEALIERTARWLYQEQTGQGTWLPAYVPPSWQSLPRAELPTTAYAAWSLIEAGYGNAREVRLAVEHLARYPDKAHDPYVLALVANALAAYDEMVLEKPGSEELDRVLARLAEMAQVDDDAAAWYGEIETFIGVVGDAADVERTALAVHALLRSQRHPRLAASGLAWLAEQRNGAGLWGARPTDWIALRTFLSAAQSAQSPFVTLTASVSVAESDVQSLAVRSREAGTAPNLVFDELVKGYNEVVLSAEGVGAVPYRIVGTYVLPWNQVEPSMPEDEEVSIEVGYDRTALVMGETLTATVDVMLNRPGAVRLAVLELGLPPGLEPIVHEWTEWVENGIVSGYRREGERMIVHLAGLSAEEPVRLNYRLRARFPLSVRTLPTRAYDAANPGRAAVREPVRIEVSRQEED